MFNGLDWANFYIDDWKGKEGFGLVIESSFGTWSHNWRAPGPGGIHHFLSTCDRHYLSGKLSKMVFDANEFEKNAWEAINEAFKNGEIDIENRDMAFEDVGTATTEYDGREIQSYLYHNAESKFWNFDESFPSGEIIEPSFTRFYRIFWKKFIDELAKIDFSEPNKMEMEIKEILGKANNEPTCIPGCKHFTGGEIMHHPDCDFYPESFTQIHDNTKMILKTLVDIIEKNKTEMAHKMPDMFLSLFNDSPPSKYVSQSTMEIAKILL